MTDLQPGETPALYVRNEDTDKFRFVGAYVTIEQSDREALRGAIAKVLCIASNFPEKASARILGQDMTPLIDLTTDAVIAHLAAQPVTVEPVTGTVEWGCTWDGRTAPVRMPEDEAREFSRSDPRGRIKLYKRVVHNGPWEEISA